MSGRSTGLCSVNVAVFLGGLSCLFGTNFYLLWCVWVVSPPCCEPSVSEWPIVLQLADVWLLDGLWFGISICLSFTSLFLIRMDNSHLVGLVERDRAHRCYLFGSIFTRIYYWKDIIHRFTITCTQFYVHKLFSSNKFITT